MSEVCFSTQNVQGTWINPNRIFFHHCSKCSLRSIYNPQTIRLFIIARNKVGARLCFYTCLWFCSPPPPRQTPPPGRNPPGQTPPGRHTLRADTPPGQTPPGRYGQHPTRMQSCFILNYLAFRWADSNFGRSWGGIKRTWTAAWKGIYWLQFVRRRKPEEMYEMAA